MRVQSSIGRELIEALLRARNALEKLHVQLQTVTRLRLLIADANAQPWDRCF